MSKPLDGAAPDNSPYERPNQEWVCGWAAEGRPCRMGPDEKGHCRVTCACFPLRKGDRWHCTRPASAGGPCSDGPLPDGRCVRPITPCQPVRSLRSRRGLVAWCASALSLGVLLWLLGGPWREEILSPGELTFQHGTVTESCAACHEAGDKTESMLAATFRKHDGIDESQRCLDCHKLGMNALVPHGFAPLAFEQGHPPAGKVLPTSGPPFFLTAARMGPGVPGAADGTIACAVCHREHRGKYARLAQMDNQRCQACHAQPFSTLADGHPELGGYPYKKRTQLNFDHSSHLGRHFAEAHRLMPDVKPPISCYDCHQQEPAGQLMLVRGFEETCAQCHSSQIKERALGGIPFLNVPGIDLDSIRQREAKFPREQPPPFAIGDWPSKARGELSPFMRLLLSVDERFVQAEAELRGQVDIRDLRQANDKQLRAVEQYAWAVKELFYELIHKGLPALHARLEKCLNRPLTNYEQSCFTGDLPPDLVFEAQQRWWPGLNAEVMAYRSGKPLPLPDRKLTPDSQPASKAALLGRWYDADYTLSYRPQGHADDFMRSWLDLGARSFGLQASTPVSSIFAALSDPFAPGRCIKCHGIEADEQGRHVHWLGKRRVPNEHKFTKFAHFPHFSLVGPKGCQACHVMNEKADFEVGFVRKDYSANSNAHVFQSNFLPMDRAACAFCHTQKAAGDSCLMCHNYHVGILPPALPNAPLSTHRSSGR